MKEVYSLLKLIKSAFKCFEVQLILGDTEDEDGEFESCSLVLFSTLVNDPIEISINIDKIDELDINSILQHLRFELSSLEENNQYDFYFNTSNMIH